MSKASQEPFYMAEFVDNSLRSAIADACKTMLGVEVEVFPSVKEQPFVESGRTVAGVIGWVGEWMGTGVISCRPECACRFAGLMLGGENASLNEDSLDAVAEMANIIFGSVKTDVEEITSAVALSTPTIIYGSDLKICNSSESFTITPVKLEDHLFHVKLQFKQANEKGSVVSHF